jgi:hypothetical protein
MVASTTWSTFQAPQSGHVSAGAQIVAAGIPRSAASGLRSLVRVRAIHALLFTLLVSANYFFRLLPFFDDALDLFVSLFTIQTPSFFGGFLLIGLVQSKILPGRARAFVLFCTVLVWSVACATWVAWGPHERSTVSAQLVTPSALFLDQVWTMLIYFSLAAWAYESADRAARATAALREAELARRSAERWVLELRLGVLQARLEPRVLFDTLDEAGELYPKDPEAAEHLLDALIDYLRCALPKLRETESTLGSEIDLAVAYARVLRGPGSKQVAVQADLDPGVGDARFPPMIVQPLCDVLARSAINGNDLPMLRIASTRRDGSATLSLTASPLNEAPADERLDAIRRTLLTMFAPTVNMTSTCLGDGLTRISVEVPYVAATRPDR